MPPICVIGHQLRLESVIIDEENYTSDDLPNAHFSLTLEEKESYDDKLR